MTFKDQVTRLRLQWSEVPAERKRSAAIAGGLAAAIVLVIGLSVWIFQAFIDTDPQPATVVSRDWQREIEIEMFKTVQEDDWVWDTPPDARIYDWREEVHHYRSVLSHFENYNCGTYDEPQTCTRAVYRSEPVYETRAYYEVDRWRNHRWIVAKGSELVPTWPPLPDTLNSLPVLGNERQGSGTRERYTIYVQCEACNKGSHVGVENDEWSSYPPGTRITAMVTARGVVKDIKIPAQGT